MNIFDLPKTQCVAFTGYRPGKIKLQASTKSLEEQIKALVRPIIIELYERGFRLFISGVAEGFDLWAATEVISLRESNVCPEVKLAAAIPYRGQEARYNHSAKECYSYVLSKANYQIVLSDNYYHECFYRRNDFMIDNTSMLIAYYDGQSGGTQYTVRAAIKQGIPILNVCESEPSLF